jgi:hypothetical protein
VARAIYEAGIPKGGKYYHQWEDLESEGFYAQHDLAMKQAHAAIGVCRAAFLPPPEARPIATDDQIERVARAICEATSGPFEMLDDVGRDALRHEARAAIAAMAPALSPELIDKLNKLATYLTERGEYKACDLIDTVVERLTHPPGEKP